MMISIVDNDSNSSNSLPPASPYTKRHPRRKSRKNKITASPIESDSNLVNRIVQPAYQSHDEIVELFDFVESETPKIVSGQEHQQCKLKSEVGATDSTLFYFQSSQNSPISSRYPNATSRNERKVQTADWTPSSSETEDFNKKYEQHIRSKDTFEPANEHPTTSDFALPVVLHRRQSLRNRQNPNYNGLRTRRPKRVIDKNGGRNIGFLNIRQRSWRFFKDFSTTMIDEQWRYVITVFALSYCLCWILFACLWFLIAHAHGDLNFDKDTGERLSDGPNPCVEGAFNFSGFLLFSIETQVSIGYGSKFPNEDCPEAILLMVIQIVTGVAIEGAMVGIVYAKMIRPSRHSSDMKFSKKAVICKRDSKLCLVFRVCDSRSNHVIESKIQAYWFDERFSLEGENLQQFQHSLKLENQGRIFLIFPTTVCHVIDEKSPLYDLSASDLLHKKFEIVVTLTGSSRSTGQMTQSRTSYLAKEIMWGNRFVKMTHYNATDEVYVADYDKFDKTIQIDTPLCSARRLQEVMHDVQQQQYFGNVDDLSEYDAAHLNYNPSKDDHNSHDSICSDNIHKNQKEKNKTDF